MGKTNTYLEINGRRYEADTAHKAANSYQQASALRPANPPVNQVMDGVVVRRQQAIVPPASSPKTAERKPHTKAETTHRKTQSTKTLMRHAVRKPKLGGDLLHSKTLPMAAAQTSSVPAKALWQGVSSERAQRAQTVPKHTLVNRFTSGGLFTRTAVLQVQNPPHTGQQQSSNSAKHKSSEGNQGFSHALATAQSHQQPRPARPRLNRRVAKKLHVHPKIFNIGVSLVAILLLGAFFLYQNLPNLTVRLAAAKAGFNASLPSYHPAGFSLKGPVQFAKGELTLNYQANSDNRSFQVKQQVSDWNSDTLLQSYITKNNQTYQTYQDDNRIVFINNNGANLVTGSKWIQVSSDGSLSTDQLLHIVKSIH